MGNARIDFNGHIKVWVSDKDIEGWDGYHEAVLAGTQREDILTSVAHDKIIQAEGNQGLQIDADGANIVDDQINWEQLLHPAQENPNIGIDDVPNTLDFRDRPPKESLSSYQQSTKDVGPCPGCGSTKAKEDDYGELWCVNKDCERNRGHRKGTEKTAADSNPVVRQANDCLKIAKVLANLLNELAGLDQTSREQIAAAAGLQQLPESIDRLYELADQARAGGVQPMQQAYASYCGWDPEILRRQAKPFVDSKTSPIEVLKDPAEEFRFERERTSHPAVADVPMDK